jgi:hypothetical protein
MPTASRCILKLYRRSSIKATFMMKHQVAESIAMPERKGPLEILPHADHAMRLFYQRSSLIFFTFLINNFYLNQYANILALIQRLLGASAIFFRRWHC